MTRFEAFVGFRELQEISDCLEDYPEFKQACTTEVAEKFIKIASSTTATVDEKKEALKMLFKALQTCSELDLKSNITNLVFRIKDSQKTQDQLILRLNQQYENDVGIFCALMLNYILLEPGQSIFLAANEPHAYLSGDCVECKFINRHGN